MLTIKNYNVKQIGEAKTLELYLYGEIMADSYDWWSGKVVESKTSANYIRKSIDEAGEINAINVYINSCGGSVAEGNAIYNILKRQNVPITVYVDAFAYSVASVVAMAGDKVIMPSNTVMMIHNAIMGAYGNATELRKAADDLDVMNEASCSTYLVKTAGKIDKMQLTAMLDAETFMTAEKAFELGFCDEITNPVDTASALEVIEQAKQLKNPYAKQAYEQLKKPTIEKKPSSPPAPPAQQTKTDGNDDENDFIENLKEAFTKIFI